LTDLLSIYLQLETVNNHLVLLKDTSHRARLPRRLPTVALEVIEEESHT
jgi:hypothetical protein